MAKQQCNISMPTVNHLAVAVLWMMAVAHSSLGREPPPPLALPRAPAAARLESSLLSHPSLGFCSSASQSLLKGVQFRACTPRRCLWSNVRARPVDVSLFLPSDCAGAAKAPMLPDQTASAISFVLVVQGQGTKAEDCLLEAFRIASEIGPGAELLVVDAGGQRDVVALLLLLGLLQQHFAVKPRYMTSPVSVSVACS